MAKVTEKFIFGQIEHWLSTLTNGYLGSNYGIDLKQYLNKPMSTFDGDAIIAKMRQDIPILQILDSSNLNIYFQKTSFEKINFYIEVLGVAKEYTVPL